jgi:lysophospholipase
VHGLAEHSGRYADFAGHFVSRGFAVSCFDLRGHGKSGGRRGYVTHFEDYLEDLDILRGLSVRDNPSRPLFLIGHSVGGLIACAYAASGDRGLQGLVLSGPTLKPGASVSPLTIALARVLSALAPRLGVSTIDASSISRDKAVIDAYVSDPLVYRGKIKARLGGELIKAMEALPAKLPRIAVPVLILHGSADRLSNIEGSSMLHRAVASRDKTLRVYDGLYHEVFNEPERESVFEDLENWLTTRLEAPGPI